MPSFARLAAAVRLGSASAGAASLTLLLSYAATAAATGICDLSPPTSTQACIDAIQANGSVVNDIFTDVNGLTGPQLPVFGVLYNQWPGCDTTSFAGCSGQSNAPADCPGQYACLGLPNTFANASAHLNALDRLWWHPCRIGDHSLVNGCPQFGACVADGTPGNYLPWEGLVFDLGGPSNKVAIFAQNDHGPQPCESTEYTVYLSDNPFAQDLIVDPQATGVDPQKWNRAVLSAIYTKGWIEVRGPDPAGHAACGDTALYSVEEDSFVSVYALPCGITFRYTAIVAGNDGLDFMECAFDSNEAELDAVAGLTESGSGVCPDVDGDLYVDCNCPGAPPVCDCDDLNSTVHPGAPEPCDAGDLDCDGNPGSCDPGLVCYQSLCLSTCNDENEFCPVGSDCAQTAQGGLCVPVDCSAGGCPPGSICSGGVCVPACTGVSCPGDQLCIDGQCLDPCAGIQCPGQYLCQAGVCVPPCSCFFADAGCAGLPGTVCDSGTGLCVAPACVGANCPPPSSCDPATGQCIPFCNPDVVCPQGQKCVDPLGCVPLCDGVMCPQGSVCNPQTGMCDDTSCQGVICNDPQICVNGQCVDPPDGGVTGSGGGSGATSGGTAGTGDPGETGDCSCRVAPHRSWAGALGLLVALGALLSRRRRG